MLFLKEYSKKFWRRYLISAFLSLTEQQKKALFAALSRKDVFTILSTGHGKYIFCYNTVIPLNKLTCLGQQNKKSPNTEWKFPCRKKKHTTLYKYVIIFGAAWFSCDAQKRSNQRYFWHRPIRLTQCCTQFKSPGDNILCVLHLHYNVAFTFKWYGNSWNKTFYSQRVWIGYNIELAE